MTIDPELILRLASVAVLVGVAVWVGYGWRKSEEWEYDPVSRISGRDGE